MLYKNLQFLHDLMAPDCIVFFLCMATKSRAITQPMAGRNQAT